MFKKKTQIVVGSIIAPKYVHILVPGGRKAFADMAKLRILGWGDYPASSGLGVGEGSGVIGSL